MYLNQIFKQEPFWICYILTWYSGISDTPYMLISWLKLKLLILLELLEVQ